MGGTCAGGAAAAVAFDCFATPVRLVGRLSCDAGALRFGARDGLLDRADLGLDVAIGFFAKGFFSRDAFDFAALRTGFLAGFFFAIDHLSVHNPFAPGSVPGAWTKQRIMNTARMCAFTFDGECTATPKDVHDEDDCILSHLHRTKEGDSGAARQHKIVQDLAGRGSHAHADEQPRPGSRGAS